jgi:hypothetical protein
MRAAEAAKIKDLEREGAVELRWRFDERAGLMSNKELVMEAVRKLPEDASLDDISEEIATLAAIRRGEEAADAGDVVPHDEVKKRFASWTSK